MLPKRIKKNTPVKKTAPKSAPKSMSNSLD
jgi:hypothetical protein